MMKQTGFLKHPVTNQTDELFGTRHMIRQTQSRPIKPKSTRAAAPHKPFENQIYIPATYDLASEVPSEAPSNSVSYFSALSQTRSSAGTSNLVIDVEDSVSAKYLSGKPERQRSR
jgi:uncharacterized protein YkwD